MKYVQILLVVFFSCLSQIAIASDAITMGKQIENTSEALLYQKQFVNLNELEEKYRTEQSRLPDGRWKLTFFYQKLGSVSKRGAEKEWQHQFKLVDEWIRETPNHPAPYLAKANMLVRYAWDARGNGYSNTVKESDWELFHERISMANQILVDSAGITGNNPF